MKTKTLFVFLAAIGLLLAPHGADAQAPLSTIALRLQPSLDVPVGSNASYYLLGGSGALTAEYKPPIAFPLVVNVGIGYGLQPLNLTSSLTMNIFSAWAGLGVQVPFLTRLSAGVYAGGGYFFGLLYDELGQPVSGGNPLVTAGADLSFFITPNLSLGVGAGFRSLLGSPDALLNTVGVYLGTLYRFPISGSVGFGPAPTKP